MPAVLPLARAHVVAGVFSGLRGSEPACAQPGLSGSPPHERGGAIVHDRELTYSIVVPRGHRLAVRRLALYRAVHTSLIELLSELGVSAFLYGGPGETTSGRRPFLCFQRRAAGDVLVSHAKVAGSAQRRSPGAVLQHGSVLVARSPAAQELPGLNELLKTPIREPQLVEAWLDRLGRQLGARAGRCPTRNGGTSASWLNPNTLRRHGRGTVAGRAVAGPVRHGNDPRRALRGSAFFCAFPRQISLNW